jgi:hypothetical protein
MGFLAVARSAQADVVILEKDGWTVATDGRVNGFYSFETGDYQPTLPDGTKGNHGLVGTPFGNNPDDASEGSKFTTSRIHTGYVGSILGFTVKKQISERLKVTGHVAIWWPIETDQFRGYSSMVPDPRESYVKLEGTWGGLLAGRALSLHDRGGTVTDFKYANGYSVGGVCNAVGQGPLCGNIGYGYQFPGFAAGIVYNTPNLSGFQWTVGLYDPVRIGAGNTEFGRTPVPRIESEANYDLDTPSLKLSLYVNGLWQRAGGDIAGEPRVVNAYGAAYGARVELGGFKLGAGGNWDKGTGDMIALVGTVPMNDQGELRTGDGYFGQLMYTIGDVDLAAGGGITRVQELATDVINNLSVIKSRLGLNAGINYHLGPAVLNAQVFRAQHTYWLGEKQNMTFVHAGMTFVW